MQAITNPEFQEQIVAAARAAGYVPVLSHLRPKRPKRRCRAPKRDGGGLPRRQDAVTPKAPKRSLRSGKAAWGRSGGVAKAMENWVPSKMRT